MASLNFNLSDLDDSIFDAQPSFELLPDGTYTLIITEGEMKTTQKGGQMLTLTTQVVDGPHKGRKIWDNLNIINATPASQEMAERKLGCICKALGIGGVNDPSELYNVPFKAEVHTEIGTNGYSDKNRLKSVDPQPLGGGITPAPQVQAAPQAVATSAAPWAK
jgi:hypothetical protein